MAQTGLGKGLAYRHDFGADINQLWQTENYKSQIDVEKRRKAQMYGKMLEQGHVRGANNTRRLQEDYDRINNEFANFVTENPGWETDPGLFAKATAISGQYLNNDIIREDEQVAQNFQALQQKMASGTMEKEDMDKQMGLYTNYMENGGDPYVFINPKQVEFSDIISNAVDSIGVDTKFVTYTNAQGVPVTRQVSTPKAGGVKTMTDNIMNNETSARAATALWRKPEMQQKFESPHTMVAHNIKIGQQQARGREIIDPVYKMNYEAGLANQGIPESHVIDNVINPWLLHSAGEDVTFQPNQANIALTGHGEVGASYNMTAQDKAYFLGKNRDVTSGSSEDFMLNQHNIRTEATGAKRIVDIDGLPYVATDIIATLPVTDQFTDDSNNTSREVLTSSGVKIEKFLQDAGFDTYEGATEGLSIGIFDGQKVKGRYYEGTTYMPADFDEMKLENYDKESSFGVKEIQGIRRRGDYKNASTRIDMLNQAKPTIDLANKEFPEAGFHLDPQGDEIISKDGRMGYDLNGPEGKKRYTR